MDINLIMWIVFWVVIALALFIDLVVLNRRKGDLSIKEAIKMICIWVSLALLFGVVLYFTHGRERALEFITGYIVEYSLSVDNMFVFLMIFTFFAIPKNYQPKVLIYGVLGAVVLRFIFIFVGVQLINTFAWIIYVFGGVLILTAVKMLIGQEGEIHPEKNIAFRILKKFFPFKPEYKGVNFFVKENGVLFATPMLAAVFVVEMSDILFAIDSIPAVLSISRNTFIVYTSNIFAIIGLRSLYFLLSGLAEKFKFLQFGVAVILFFVGFKMIISHYYHIPTFASLSIILLVLCASIVISLMHDKKQKTN